MSPTPSPDVDTFIDRAVARINPSVARDAAAYDRAYRDHHYVRATVRFISHGAHGAPTVPIATTYNRD